MVDPKLTQAGRVILATTFILGFLFHVGGPAEAAKQVPAIFGMPLFWVYFTGVAQLAFAVSVLTGRRDRLAALCLALMMLVFIATIHVPRALSGDFLGVISIMRDLGYIGAALLYAGAAARDTRVALVRATSDTPQRAR